MNSALLLWIVIVGFLVGYFVYLRLLVRKVFPLDAQRTTPAYEYRDGLDYVPAKNWLMLFGHHFASIAGAAPILGPVIAFSIWGWGPALLWIFLGSIFLGGVHDFSSLYVSIRSRGLSVSEIGEQAISRKTKYLFAGFIVLTLILIVAVFLYFSAKTFLDKPEIVLPSLGLIPVAMLVGFLIYRLNFNVFLATLFGLSGLAILAYLGELFPIQLGAGGLNFWILILLLYCIFASLTPVNILLQPRDYISSFLLFAGIGLGTLGILFQHQALQGSFYLGFGSKIGPLWPMLFVTIACGAISGFHSLIASGTTSKQISNERYAPRIGYGGMLLEGLLACIALISVALLSSALFRSTLTNTGVVSAFGKGYGLVVFPFLGRYGESFAILVLNAFILTTLDTATRITRYVLNEVFNWKEKFFTTLLPVLLASLLAFSGKWMNIWAIFGSANQLIAALALIIVSGWLLRKKRSIFYTVIPAIFMVLVTLSALVYKLVSFLREKNFLLTLISLMLISLSIWVIWEAKFLFKFGRKN